MSAEAPDLRARAETTVALLMHFSWSIESEVPGRYVVWGRRGDDEQILVPTDPSRGDYAVLLQRALSMIERRYGTEAIRVEDLLRLQQDAALDLTRWKKESSVDAGLIGWQQGMALYQAASDSLSAAAKATHERRLHYGTSGAYLAQEFLDRTLMGQTQIGSFVVTAHTPAHARFHVTKHSETASQKDWRNAEQVTGREILNVFERSIQATRAGLDEYRQTPNIEAFVPLVDDGLSAELARALAALTTGSDAAVVIERVGISGESTPRPVEVTFDAVESDILKQVFERFTIAPPPTPVTIRGEVSRLDNSTTNPVRLIRMDIAQGADVEHAKVRLDADQYAAALEANGTGRWVEVTGTLEKEGRDYWLYNARNLRVLDEAEGPDSARVDLFSVRDLQESLPQQEAPQDEAAEE